MRCCIGENFEDRNVRRLSRSGDFPWINKLSVDLGREGVFGSMVARDQPPPSSSRTSMKTPLTTGLFLRFDPMGTTRVSLPPSKS